MPDFLKELDHDNNRGPDTSNSVAEIFGREAYMLGYGVAAGVEKRLNDVAAHPVQSGLELVGTVGVGALAAHVLRRGGLGADLLKAGMVLAVGGDVLNRGIPTLSALAESAADASTVDHNKKVVANNFGTAVFDYTVLGLAAYGGGKLYGKMNPLKITEFQPPELRPRNMIDPTSPRGGGSSPFDGNAGMPGKPGSAWPTGEKGFGTGPSHERPAGWPAPKSAEPRFGAENTGSGNSGFGGSDASSVPPYRKPAFELPPELKGIGADLKLKVPTMYELVDVKTQRISGLQRLTQHAALGGFSSFGVQMTWDRGDKSEQR